MNIEEEFFKTFGIEPKYQDTCTVEEKYWSNEELANEYGTFDMYMNAKCGNQENCTTECSCAYQKEIYPQITDKILLELICILNSANVLIKSECLNDLKNEILGEITVLCEYAPNDETKEWLKTEVCKLFESEEEYE